MTDSKKGGILNGLFGSRTLICCICKSWLEAGEKQICPSCWEKIRRVHEPRCERCGRPLGETDLCLQCRGHDYSFQTVFSWGIYTEVLRDIIHLYKYRRQIALGPELIGRMMREMPVLGRLDDHLIVPVPLGARKMVRRGFNQAEVLGDCLAGATGTELVRALVRRGTRPQAGHGSAERQTAVRGRFHTDRRLAERIRGRRILLVDDVFTTGSTADECSRALLGGGAAQVTVLTVATTMLNGSK